MPTENLIPKKQYRYPGATPFDIGQEHIFFGRKQDTHDLYRLIQREALVVLYGKSGLGKSSLLNAGIVPACLREGTYAPLVIRFGAWTEGKTETPLSTTKAMLTTGFQKDTFLKTLLPEEDSLWYHAKNRQLNGGGRPLLLFDQFEELFSYPEAQVLAFQQELAELRNTGIPLRFRRRLEADDAPELAEAEEDLLESALETRILFAIRSDRMHLLARLGDYLPNVLRHSCELKALTEEDARDAIILPAQSAAAGFATAPFAYSPTAVDRLLNFLRDKQDGRIEGILLQMLCEHYERKQVEAQQLTLLDLPQIGDPNEVVRNYYEEKISSLSEAQQNAARRLIEDGLVSNGEAMRLTLHEAYIAQEFRVHKNLLETLVDSRLLRAEPFLRGGYTYELSHDRLVPAVLGARNLRREAEARAEAQRLKAEAEKAKRQLRMVQGLLAAAVLALLVAGYFGYHANEQRKAADEAKDSANAALQKADKLINAFYFYEDRFALAYGQKGIKNVFYFIDKNGEEVIQLGRWEKAEQFDYTGFAKVKKYEDGSLVDYLLDTLGKTYRVAYEIKDLSPDIRALDLSDKELSAIPKVIFDYPALEVLLLNQNKLSELPKRIGELKNLTDLYLGKNKLSSLPAQFGELKNLTSLDLSYNQLSGLPAQIGELKNLTSLDLNVNQLSSLPEQIGQLKNLISLDLSVNEFSSLPEQIGQLKNLISLYLTSNQLSSLPQQIGDLKNLRSLYLTSNQLSSLPQQIGDLKNLTDLYLSDNKLSSLPQEIGVLKNLTSLNLSFNQLSSLPQEIGDLKSLTLLDLSFNQLSSLPWEIWGLKKLESLSLSSNQLSSLPQEIGDLKSLTLLDLSSNQLNSLSQEIGALKNLTELYLNYNELSSLPSQIGELKSLALLDLSENQFSRLPREIGDLKSLTSLDLSFNQLRSLPSQVGELKNLSELYLLDNLIPEAQHETIRKLLPNCEIQF